MQKHYVIASHIVTLSRPGMSRPGLSRPGRSRPGLSKPGPPRLGSSLSTCHWPNLPFPRSQKGVMLGRCCSQSTSNHSKTGVIRPPWTFPQGKTFGFVLLDTGCGCRTRPRHGRQERPRPDKAKAMHNKQSSQAKAGNHRFLGPGGPGGLKKYVYNCCEGLGPPGTFGNIVGMFGLRPAFELFGPTYPPHKLTYYK